MPAILTTPELQQIRNLKSKRSKTKATHILSESDGRPEKESGGENRIANCIFCRRNTKKQQQHTNDDVFSIRASACNRSQLAPPHTLNDTRAQGASSREGGSPSQRPTQNSSISPSKTMVTQHNKKARAKAMSKRKRNRQVLRSADETEEEEEGQNNARLTFGATDPNCVSTSVTPHAPLGCSVSSTTTTSKTHAQHRPPQKKNKKKKKRRGRRLLLFARGRVWNRATRGAPSVPR